MTEEQSTKELGKELSRSITQEHILAQRNAELQAELDRLTAVHTFDPEDESTWPEEGLLFAGYDQKDRECSVFRVMDGSLHYDYSGAIDSEWGMPVDILSLWSYSAPALQAHLESPKNKDA